MTIRALFAAGGHVYPAANDVPASSPYRAHLHLLVPGGQTAFMQDHCNETLLFIERGQVEIMINGAVHTVGRGQSARIAAGLVFAYRNAGSDNARVFRANVDPAHAAASALNVTVAFAAA